MCNFDNLKKIYKYRGKLKTTLIFKECLEFILSNLAKGYSYREISDLLQVKVDEEFGAGVFNITSAHIFQWGQKGFITPEKIEEYKNKKVVISKTENTTKDNIKIFDNLVKG